MATALLTSRFFLHALGGTVAAAGAAIDILDNTVKLTLHTSTHTPSQTGDSLFADVDNEVTNGSGYTTGGVTLGSKTYATTSLTTSFDAADASWTALTKTHRYGWLWVDTAAAPVDPLIMIIDTGGDQTNTGTDLTYVWAGAGIWAVTVA